MIKYIEPIVIRFYRLYVEGIDDYKKCYIGSTKKADVKTRLCEHQSSYRSCKTTFFNSSKELFKDVEEKEGASVKIQELGSILIHDFESMKYACNLENAFIEQYKEDCVNKRKAKR
jgi:hypothetical protein